MKYLYLFLAIVFEIIATSALQSSKQFTQWKYIIVVIVGYVLAFYFLSLTLKYFQLGITYAIWSGVGIVLLTIIGVVAYKQVPDTMAVIGIIFIIIGVLIINLFSKTTGH